MIKVKNYIILIILILCSSLLVYSTNKIYSEDEAIKEYNFLVGKCNKNADINNDSAIYYGAKALLFADNHNLPFSGLHLLRYAQALRAKGDFLKATEYFKKAIIIISKEKDYYNLSKAYYVYGFTIIFMNDYNTAEKYFNKSIQLAEKHNIPEFIFKGTYGLATIAGFNNKLQKENELFHKCIDLSAELNYDGNIELVYFYLGVNYFDQNDLENSVFYIEVARKIKEKKNKIVELARLTNRLGWTYYLMEDLEKSENIYFQCIEYSKQINNERLRGNCIANLGNILRDRKEYKKALKYYEHSLSILDSVGYYQDHYWIYRDISVLYEQMNDFENAYKNYQNFISYSDSLNLFERNIRLAESQSKYEKEVNNQELYLLEKENTIKQEQLIENNIITISICIVILLIIVLFALQNRKQKLKLSQQITEISQQVVRQQMNPHFIFNTLNSIQFTLFKNDKLASNRYLTMFAKYMRLVLDNSQHKSILIAEEISSLKLYLELEANRFKDKLKYELNIDSEIDPYEHKIPSFLIQPYIENSINQMGINNEILNISISVKLEQKNILVEIKDNIHKEFISKKDKDQNISGTQITENKILLINSLYNKSIYYNLSYIKGTNNNIIGRKILIDLPISA